LCILVLKYDIGGNNFDDFPENQLTIDFAFLCKPTWGTLFFLVLISLGERRSPKNIWKNERRSPAFLLDYSTVDDTSTSTWQRAHRKLTAYLTDIFEGVCVDDNTLVKFGKTRVICGYTFCELNSNNEMKSKAAQWL